ncbi:sulfotransferase family protein [Alcanivorax sp. JB21]|uniref:sulfotransferase family protein n=1 Tax=Alcanivorax limicola TaxID=2874102 RepID=UPI001CC01DFB|nr:sulfotransferase family protein [Alcanivorax limicola]MBZ2190368.1 sulfotransferase family protein [Alcanivorax limicola]
MNHYLSRYLYNRFTLPYRPFYRAYPYDGGLSINSADSRGMVDLALGFFCNRVPKAANSAIVTHLAQLKFGRDIASHDAKRAFRTPGTLNRKEVEQFADLFRFTVVRNPYSRVLSAYLDKMARFPERNTSYATFDAFVERLSQDPAYLLSNAHWAPQTALMLIPVEDFDFIGKVESLDQDLATITAKIHGKATPLATADAGPPSTGASKKLRQYYHNDALIAAVRDIYQADFSRLTYPTDFPA